MKDKDSPEITSPAAPEYRAPFIVEGTPCDGGRIEDEFSDLKEACLRAQGIEEDGGSARVVDAEDREIDHWNGYRVGLTPEGGIVLDSKISNGASTQ